MKQKSTNPIEIIGTNDPAIIVKKQFKYVIFIVEGGAGKNIMATIPLHGLKLKYPDKKIIVVASWPDVFRYNRQCYISDVFKSNGYST